MSGIHSNWKWIIGTTVLLGICLIATRHQYHSALEHETVIAQSRETALRYYLGMIESQFKSVRLVVATQHASLQTTNTPPETFYRPQDITPENAQLLLPEPLEQLTPQQVVLYKPALEGLRVAINSILQKSEMNVQSVFFLIRDGAMAIPIHQNIKPEKNDPRHYFQQPYWKVYNAPALRTQLRLFILPSEQHESLYISVPINAIDEFIGSIIVKVPRNLVTELLSIGGSSGSSFLVDNFDNIIAQSDSNLAPRQVIPEGASYNLIPGQFRLIHQTNRGAIYLSTAQQALIIWLGALVLLTYAFLFSRLQASYRHVKRLMITDPLTKTLNRRGFRNQARLNIALYERSHIHWAIAILDIDHFKRINDSYGHAVGDDILSSISATIKKCLRKTDLLCRWGGEEFVLLIAYKEHQDLNTLLERIRETIAKTTFGKEQLNITISIGAVDARAEKPLDELIEIADQRLYQAKESGRNRIICDGPNQDNKTDISAL